MFCNKCGTQLEDGALFCNNCGAKVNQGETVATETEKVGENKSKQENVTADTKISINLGQENESATSSKFSKYITGKTIIGAVVAIVLVIVIVIAVKSSRKIDLNKYVSVEYSGYETAGTAQWEFDSDAFEEDYGDKLKLDTNKLEKETNIEDNDVLVYLSEGFLGYSPCNVVEDLADGSLNKSAELSNGDELTFRWNSKILDEAEKYFNYKFKYSDMDFKVEGLETIKTFDPFEGVSLKFSGTSGNGKAEVVKKSQDGVYGAIVYQMDVSSGLSNGDTVTVTAVDSLSYGDLENYSVKNYGMAPSAVTKEFKVEGLGEYLTKTEDVPEDIMTSMQKQASDALVSASASWNEHVTLSSVNYIGSYFLTAKDMENETTINRLTLVLKADVSVSNADPLVQDQFSYYYPITFTNIIKLPDGTVSVDMSNYSKPQEEFYKEYDFGGWGNDRLYWYGYADLNTAFNKMVTYYVEDYEYESTVEDVIKEAK